MEIMTMAEFLTGIGTFFTESTGWLGDVVDIITASPPLTIMVFGMSIVGFSVGLLGRLIRL